MANFSKCQSVATLELLTREKRRRCGNYNYQMKDERFVWVRQYYKERHFLDKCPEAPCSEKPWKSPGSNQRHQIALLIGSTALYRLSQIPIYLGLFHGMVLLGLCLDNFFPCSYQKLRSGFTCSATVRKRTMERQRVKICVREIKRGLLSHQ